MVVPLRVLSIGQIGLFEISIYLRLRKLFTNYYYYYYYYYYYFAPLRVFHTSVSRWSFTGVWSTGSLLKSPVLADLKSCSLNGLYSCSYFQFLQTLYQFFGDCTEPTVYNKYYFAFMFHSFFCSLPTFRYLFFFSLSFSFTLWSTIVSQNPKKARASHSAGQIPGYAYTICSSGQTEIPCTIPSRSPFPPSRV